MNLYSAEQAAPLARRLAEVLIADPLDPMRAEWMAVPSDGMRRWLLLELARYLGASGPGFGDGVAANFDRAYPGSLRNLVFDADAGRNSEGEPSGRLDPWHIDRMVWALLPVFDDLVDRGGMPQFTALPAGGSRFARVRAVADLFDRYHLHRPEMIRAWAHPEGSHRGLVDGNALPLQENAHWQPELWRLLKEEIGTASPPERMRAVLERLAGGSVELDQELPSRLILFGFTALPGRDFLAMMEAVAGADRQIHLFLLEPHHFDKGRLVERWRGSADRTSRLRSLDDTGDLVLNPLLRSWGRLARESALLLGDELGADQHRIERVPSDGPGPTSTLLGRLQADIRADVASGPGPVAIDDRSVQFHSCSGPMREVQVARDAILHILADDESGLTEEDVLVVCPGLDRFAPLVEAVFGASAPTSAADPGPPRLRYRIADRSIRAVNPVLGATAALLELVSGRFEVSQVLDFVSLAPVRARFDFDDVALAVLADWAEGTNVRWGLDTGHRAGFGLPDSIVGNTWRSAIDQLLIGTATSDGGLDLALGPVSPFGVDSGDAELLGTFAHILGLLAGLVELASDSEVAGPGLPLATWLDALRTVCRALFKAPSDAAWQFDALERLLHDVDESAADTRRGNEVGLGMVDLRRLLEGRLDQEPGRPDFFRGGVTVTSMASLRWIPFRVVCVLGLDQDSMGSTSPDAADLIAESPQIGDPDPRSEARQLLLEAVLAARDHLVIVRDGRDVRSSHEVPQVVPAAELFDAVASLCEPGVPGDPDGWTRRLETVHPRHPFDESCLTRDGLIEGMVWSFSARDHEGAENRRKRPPGRERFLEEPIQVEFDPVVTLADLHAFLDDPVGTFVRRTLQASLPGKADEREEILPVDPTGLETYRLGQDLLEARGAGVEEEAWRRSERAKGTLPPGVLETRLFADLAEEVDDMLAEAERRGITEGEPELRDIDVLLSDHTRIVGEVRLRLHSASPGPGRIEFTRPKEKYRLSAWLDLMVLVAVEPTTPWRSVVVTRKKAAKDKSLKPVDLSIDTAVTDPRAMATRALERVVELYRKGLAQPLPLFPSYSPALYDDASPDGEWSGRDGHGDAGRPAVRLVFGDIGIDEVEDMTPEPDDPDGTGGRAARYADHLWGTVVGTVKAAT
jgi:exodeoxyribonuclease V gamma subunit